MKNKNRCLGRAANLTRAPLSSQPFQGHPPTGRDAPLDQTLYPMDSERLSALILYGA